MKNFLDYKNFFKHFVCILTTKKSWKTKIYIWFCYLFKYSFPGAWKITVLNERRRYQVKKVESLLRWDKYYSCPLLFFLAHNDQYSSIYSQECLANQVQHFHSSLYVMLPFNHKGYTNLPEYQRDCFTAYSTV